MKRMSFGEYTYCFMGKKAKRNKKIIRVLLVALALLLVHPRTIRAEVLFLKDKTIVYGTILEETTHAIKIRQKDTGKVIIFPKKEVKTVRYNIHELKKQYFYKKDKTMIAGYIVAEDAEAITLREDLAQIEEKIIRRNELEHISDVKLAKGAYTFMYNTKAQSVAIEGDFNGWRPIPMLRNGTAWQTSVEIDIMKKNDYHYRYIVDNRPEETRKIKFKLQDGKLFEDIDAYKLTFGLRCGLGQYYYGYADKLQIEQPAMGLVLQSHLPFLWQKMAFQGEFLYIKHSPDRDKNPALESYHSLVHNFFTCLFLLFDVPITKRIGLHPKIGGGYTIQNLQITGETNHELNNSFLTASIGCELAYELNSLLALIFDYKTYLEFEEKITILHTISVGVNFRL